MTYLYGIGISTGKREPLTCAIEAAAQALPARHRDWLREPARAVEVSALAQDGFECYVRNEAGTAHLAREAMSASLAAGATAPDAIDAVVLSTESFWDIEDPELAERFDPQIRLRHSLLNAMTTLGLSRAYPYANWMSGCANLGATLALAKALIETGQHRRALVVCADKVPPWAPRLMANGATVLSDLAACCIIGTEPRGYRLKKVVSCAASGLAAFDLKVNTAMELVKLMREMTAALGRLADQFEHATGRRLESYETIVGGHYHPYSLQMLCNALRIRSEVLVREARAEFGHANACDNLLTLARLDAQKRLSTGQEVVLLNTGIWSWNIVLLEKV
jgi:3-oxoacyl-[acyl-carrier-protein] synthase-3